MLGGGARLVACVLALCVAGAAAAERTVVLLVFDGVGPVLFQHHPAPSFARLRVEGAFSEALEPVFPTVSLINGFTLSTGCWPAHHGIVTNKFLDPERGLYDHSRDADWLTGCEGLHEAAEGQGVRAAALGWYGGRSSTRGPLASSVSDERSFDEFPDDAGRAAQVVEQLRRTDAQRPRLVLAYFRGPDHAEHDTGIESEETRRAVQAMDAALARVIETIEASGRPTTLLVTTDHGMRAVSHLVNVKRLLHWHGLRATAVSTGTTAFLYFDGPAEVERASAALAGYDAFEILRKGDLPEYARLGDGARVPELILSARAPYFMEDTDLWPAWLRWLGRWGPRLVWARPFLAATHGYPPDVEGMHGVLYAWGDGIARGRHLGRVRAVDVHPTAAALLGIRPGRPMDGRVVPGLLYDEASADSGS